MPAKKKTVAKVNVHHEGALILAGQEIRPGDLPDEIIESLLATGGAKKES